MTPSECDAEILRVTDALAPVFVTVGNEVASRMAASVRELVAANERAVAFEILCSNLHEFDVQVDRRTRRNLEAVGTSLGLEARLWTALHDSGS